MLKEVIWDDGNDIRWKHGSNKGGKNPKNGIFGVKYNTFKNFIKSTFYCGIVELKY